MKKVFALLFALVVCSMAIVGCNIEGVDGKDGKDGKDGITPTIEISDDGYWVINGEKTEFRATPDEQVDENPQGLQFCLLDDGTYIVAQGDAKYLSNIVIPATYKGGAVVSIDNHAFSYCESLKSITIPKSVTSIGRYAFQYCFALASIAIPDSVTSIGDGAFMACQSFTSIIIPESVTSIGSYAFATCSSLGSITFEGTVEQWNAIEFGRYWNDKVPATEVVCTNGTVPLN